MDWEIKKRGRVTYYRKKSNDVFSDLVVEELDNSDLKIRFVGMTGALAATNELGLHDVAKMNPEREIPLIFDTWEMYLQKRVFASHWPKSTFSKCTPLAQPPKHRTRS